MILKYVPEGSVVGTTIETNRHYQKIMGKAPSESERASLMSQLVGVRGFKTMVTVEPILDFEVTELDECRC